MSNSAKPADERQIETLTRREREVLDLLAQGYSAPDIAQTLTLGLSTVKFHLDNLYGKLGVNSKRQALDRARGLGLLAPAPAAALPAPQHNLPLPVTRFYGRESEIVQLREHLGEHRAVTLTGVGGVGKTRLALRTAQEAAGYAHGVWSVELAALSDPALVAQHVAAALGLRDHPGRPVLDRLRVHLQHRQLLLLLDNCEHLLDACARLAEDLLGTCSQLTVLATSREPLNLAGEAVFPIRPLPYPEPGQALSPENVEHYAAVRLFTDRARLVLPDFAVAAHNAAFVATICQRVDGLPLALELAAARMTTLSAEQLAGRLDDAFSVLTGGRRTALPRHQTLRATLDWSYQLLSEPERQLLQRLSVFAGGCTLEAAEAVCTDADLDQPLVLDHLASLVAKSMVVAQRRPGQPARFGLLEMVRQYGLEKLEAAGEAAVRRTRHLDYYLAYTETEGLRAGSEHSNSQIAKVQHEFENIRHALDWAFSGAPSLEAGPRLALMLYDCWPTQAEAKEAALRSVAWCRAHPEISPPLHAHVLGMAATYTALNDPATSVDFAIQAAEVTRGFKPAENMRHLENLRHLGWLHLWVVHDVERSRAYYAEAEAYFAAHGREHLSAADYEFYRAWFQASRANLHLEAGEYQAAKEAARESLRLFAAGGHQHEFPYVDAHNYCGAACLYLGEYDEAHAHFQEAIRFSEHAGAQNGGSRKALALRWRGFTAVRQGDPEAALGFLFASIRLCVDMLDDNITASCLGVLALLSARQDQPQRAAVLSGASAAMYARQKRQPWEDASLDTLLPRWEAGPDQGPIRAAYEAGRAMDSAEAVAYALTAEAS